jgi:hypothetical protein
MRTLLGRIELAMNAGTLMGNDLAPVSHALARDPRSRSSRGAAAGERPAVPFSALAGRFSLDRGIASTQSVALEVDGVPATVEGVVDLLLWAADLTLALTPPAGSDRPITLKIVGPLDRPQIRLSVPQTELAPTP